MIARIPLSAPDITEAEISAVSRVLRTPNLSQGPNSPPSNRNSLPIITSIMRWPLAQAPRACIWRCLHSGLAEATKSFFPPSHLLP